MRLLAVLLMAISASAVEVQQFHSHDFSFRAKAAGNPFAVDLVGDFEGPGGIRLRVPGYYDGEDRWVIRFSPTAVGEWQLRTVSSLPDLDGKTAAVSATANRHSQIHGGLRVDPVNPHHFIYEDGTRYFLLGYEADWLWAADMLDPKRVVMNRLIDQMADRGFNHVMVNVYAHDTSWAPGKSCEFDFGPAALYPWEGTNEKPDHSRLNPKFFQHYDAMMVALRDKGIVAHIMLKVYNKSVKWPAKNSREEEQFFRYMAARYQGFSNVVWDFAKESYNEKDELLQSRLIDLVRSTDAYRRLTTAHDDDSYEWDSKLNRNLDFRTDQQHSDYGAAILFDRAFRAYPVVNSEFGYEYGVEKLPTHFHTNQCTWEEQLRRAFHIYFSGGYAVYYYNNTAWDVVKPDPEAPGMSRFQRLRQVLESLPYWRMEPKHELAIGGLTLALEGEAYAFYVEGAKLTANLSKLKGTASAEWINTWDGMRVPLTVRSEVDRLTKPEAFGKAPAILVVRKK